MDDHAETHGTFDEAAALEELERLRGQIEQYKSERRAVTEQFDQFVRSFKTPPGAGATAPAANPVRERPPTPRVAPVASGPLMAPAEALPVAVEPPPDPPAASSAPLPPPNATSRSTPGTRTVIGGALILLAAGGLATWTLRNGAPKSTLPAAPGPETSPTSPRSALPPPSAAVSSSRESELTTVRRVWMRVIVDGERVLEREVPAGTRVPLKARTTIVIRTGDAGAVRLSIGGQDQGVLGGKGEVVTRTFTVPAAPAR